VKLEGPLKKECSYITVTLGPFESEIFDTLQLLLGAHLKANGYCKFRSLIHRVKCDCSVQRIGTNTNNLTTSKHVTICCQIFCIFRETGRPTCIFSALLRTSVVASVKC